MLNEEWELHVGLKQIRQAHHDVLHLPTPDYQAPSLEDVVAGVKFLEDQIGMNSIWPPRAVLLFWPVSIYVICKSHFEYAILSSKFMQFDHEREPHFHIRRRRQQDRLCSLQRRQRAQRSDRDCVFDEAIQVDA